MLRQTLDRRQVDQVDSPSDLYATLISLILRLARSGLIHGDFNEFNILIRRKTGEAVIIDFPQMVSTRHENAEMSAKSFLPHLRLLMLILGSSIAM